MTRLLNKGNSKSLIYDAIFKYVALFFTFLGIFILALFLFNIFKQGIGVIDWDFLTNFQSRKPVKAGIYAAWVGSVWIFLLTALCSTLSFSSTTRVGTPASSP